MTWFVEVLQIECIIPNLIIIGIYVFFLTSSGLTGKGGKNALSVIIPAFCTQQSNCWTVENHSGTSF